MRKIIATRCDICTYVFVRTYKIRTMETIVSNNIGSVPDAYSARTIYVSKHVPWKAPLTRFERSNGLEATLHETYLYMLPLQTAKDCFITRGLRHWQPK